MQFDGRRVMTVTFRLAVLRLSFDSNESRSKVFGCVFFRHPFRLPHCTNGSWHWCRRLNPGSLWPTRSCGLYGGSRADMFVVVRYPPLILRHPTTASWQSCIESLTKWILTVAWRWSLVRSAGHLNTVGRSSRRHPLCPDALCLSTRDCPGYVPWRSGPGDQSCLITSVLVVDDEVTSYAASFHLLHHSRKFFQPKSVRRRMLLTSGSFHLISNSTTTWTWRVVFSFLRTSDDGLVWVFHLKGCWQRLTGFLDSQFCFKCRVIQKYRLFGDWDLVSSVDFLFEECWLLTKLTVFKTRVLSNLEYGEISLPSSSSHARLLTTRSSTTSCFRSSGFCLFLFSLSLLFFVTCIGSAAQRLFFSSFSRRVLFIHQVRCLSADRALRHICPSSVSRGFPRDLGGLVVSSSVGLDGCGSKDIQVVCPVLVVREERILLIRWKVTLFRLRQ